MDPGLGLNEGISLLIRDYGLAGLVIIALTWFNYIQYKRNNTLSDATQKMGQEMAIALESLKSSINRQTDLFLRGGRGVDS